jgi:hypothetical protein
MFRSSTIIRELVLSLAKVMLEHSVHYVLIGYVVVWQHVLEWRVWCVHTSLRFLHSLYNFSWLSSTSNICASGYLSVLSFEFTFIVSI